MSTVNQQLDSTIQVITPENIAFEYQVAGPFRRFPAYFLDVIFRIGIEFGLFWMLSLFSIAVGTAWVGFWLVSFFLIGWFYGGIFETFMNGQTPGKRIFGIRVLTVNGRPINGLQAVMRNILREVDAGPMISLAIVGGPGLGIIPTGLVGLLAMAWNRRFQRLGDLVCRTMVVVEDRPWGHGVASFEDPRVFQLASYLPVDLQVSRSMSAALAQYAERRKFFTVARRREVAAHLARPLLALLGLPRDTSYDLLLCAMYYRLFIADRNQDEEHAAQAAARLRERAHPGITFLESDGVNPFVSRPDVRDKGQIPS